MTAKKPCVLFLLDWRPIFWSTREEFFCQLSQRLAKRGIVPVLFVSEQVAPEVEQRFAEAGARLVAHSYHAQPWDYRNHIVDVTREFRVLFAHVRFFDYFTALFWLCKLSGIETVMFTEANSGNWSITGIKGALLRLRTTVMCAPVRQFIAISGFIRARLEAVGVPKQKIEVVYNGVDLKSFQPDPDSRLQLREQMGVGPNTAVLIFMAVFLEWKRPELPLQVCAELARRGVDVQLWMAGKGPLGAELEAKAKALGIEKNVRWLGHQADPHRWLASADIFVHTATGEAFGNVLIEALGCGLPVVATRSGATPELIQEGKSGALVDPGPDEAARMAEAVVRVLKNQPCYSQAAAEAAKSFTTELAVEHTMKIYEPFLN